MRSVHPLLRRRRREGDAGSPPGGQAAPLPRRGGASRPGLPGRDARPRPDRQPDHPADVPAAAAEPRRRGGLLRAAGPRGPAGRRAALDHHLRRLRRGRRCRTWARPATGALEGRLVGKPVPVSEIFAAAQALEEAYARAGYVLARVVIPEQSLANGERLRLVVVNGFIERLDTAGVPEPVRGRIDARGRAARRPAQPQARRDRAPAADRRRHLRRRAALGPLARRRGRRRGPRRRGGLPPGHRLGRHRQHPRRRPRHLDARDRRRAQQRLQARRDDLLPRLRLSRAATARAASAASSPAIRAPAPSRRARSSRSARTASPSTSRATGSKTTPEPTDGIQTRTEFERLSFRAFYPVIRSRTLNVNAGLIFDAQSESQHLMPRGRRRHHLRRGRAAHLPAHRRLPPRARRPAPSSPPAPPPPSASTASAPAARRTRPSRRSPGRARTPTSRSSRWRRAGTRA